MVARTVQEGNFIQCLMPENLSDCFVHKTHGPILSAYVDMCIKNVLTKIQAKQTKCGLSTRISAGPIKLQTTLNDLRQL